MPLSAPNRTAGAATVPTAAQVEASRIAAFALQMERRHARRFDDYASLHRWSVEHLDEFWQGLWDFCELRHAQRADAVLEQGATMEQVRWFPGARLNFAENLLRYRGAADALVFWGEDQVKRRISRDELYRSVACLAAAMRARGVKAGDRVAAYMPNLPETVVAMLAASSIGAIFSSASPDFGPAGIIDRFGQIEPVMLFATDGYRYNGKAHDCRDKVREIVAQLPSVETVVMCPYLGLDIGPAAIRGALTLADFTAAYADVQDIAFEQLPFDHPLYIVFSSGTTGVPKCIVHRAGGALLLHLKEHQLHGNIREGSRLFYFCTCSWVMWNWQVSALASGAALMLYDGSPFAAGNHILFDYLQAERFTHFGTSAKFIEACVKFDLKPVETHDTSSVELLYSTGSPLADEGYQYLYRAFRPGVHVASISGGTDLLGAFVGGCPVLPVYPGEIQCAQLGMAVEVFDDDGRPVRGRKGELVCTAPFPTQPLSFWGDADGRRYHQAYFARFAGIWCHGDYCELTAHGGYIIHGRSDATLNPGGVRIGTAEIYRQVDLIDEVVESAVIGQNWPPDKPNDVRVVLFVRLRDGLRLDEALSERIRQQIRRNTTTRHVPARVVQVADVPRTKSGKIVELAIRQVVHGEAVNNTGALANPEALEHFRARPELAV